MNLMLNLHVKHIAFIYLSSGCSLARLKGNNRNKANIKYTVVLSMLLLRLFFILFCCCCFMWFVRFSFLFFFFPYTDNGRQ